MKTLLSIFVLAAIVLLAPRTTAAQDGCGYFQSCGIPDHRFDASPDNSCYAHPGCEGACQGGACHPVCGTCPPMFGANPILQQRLNALHAAAIAGDVDKVLSLASGVPGYDAFNVARQSVQLKSCSGEFILANLPVRNEAQRLFAMRLPTPSQMLASARASDRANLYFAPAGVAARASDLAKSYLAAAGAEDGNMLAQVLRHFDGPTQTAADRRR